MAGLMDAHVKPPEAIRQVYKHFQKLKPRAFDDQDNDIVDTHQLHENHPHVTSTNLLQLPANMRETFIDFAGSQIGEIDEPKIYSVNAIPGKSANLNIGSRVVI
jgi:hypothetical protein